MIEQRTVLCVIPARGKSKGVPRKNLSRVHGKTLLWYAAQALKPLSFIDHIVLSTEDEEIKNEALACGLEVPFSRPEELAGDLVGDLPVLQHAVAASEEAFEKTFDIILMVQPTCPMRKPRHIQDCVDTLLEEEADSAWTVSPVDLKYHPLKLLRLADENLIYYAPEGKDVTARQQLGPVYVRNGACYAWKRDILMNDIFLPEKTVPVIIDDKNLIDIDSPEDLAACERILAEGGLKD